MADRTNILEQTVEYQSLDLLRLKTGQVVQITDESIDIWATAESHQRGDESNRIYFCELAETVNEDLLSNPHWTSHNIPTAVALHYDKAGWEPHCTGGGFDYPIFEFGDFLDGNSGERRWEIWASHHNADGAPDSPNEPVWAHLYDMKIDNNSTWWSLQFDSSAALTDFVASHDDGMRQHNVDVAQVLAPFFASEFNSDREDNEHRWNTIDRPISRFYGHHGWDYNVTGGGCNFPALWFGPTDQSADGETEGRYLIMVGMEKDVGVAPEDITKPVAAVLYDEPCAEYIRTFPSSVELIDYISMYNLGEDIVADEFAANWKAHSEINQTG